MVTEPYRRFLTRASAALQHVVAEVAGRVSTELTRARTPDPALRSARSEAAEALGRYPAAWALGFAESLGTLVEDAIAPEGTRPLDLDSLAIMDDERVQEEIEVVNAARVLADDAGSPWHRLQWLESALQLHHPLGRASAIAPASIGRALWRATEHMPLSLAARREAVRSAVRLLAPELGPLYRQLAESTEQAEGIGHLTGAPGSPASPPVPLQRRPAAGSVDDFRDRAGDSARFDVTRPGALIDLMGRQAGEPGGAAPSSRFLLTQPFALDGDGSAVPRLIHHHRDELALLGTPEASSAAMSLIGRIFDEILADATLDPEAARWIGRLQPAVLRLATQDASLLQSHRHPAWSLINQLATLFGEDAGQRPPNLVAWLERVVTTLQASPRHERFEAITRKLSAWRAAQVQGRLTEMAPTVDLLRQHAHLAQGVETARARLERRLNASRADEAVRRFVASVWALVCAQEVAAGPEPVAGGTSAWDTATDLMWSTSPARSRLDGPTLVQMIPGLVDRLTQGMERLGLAPSSRDAWLGRMTALHVQALRRGAEEAQTDMPLTIDLALEDELPPAGDSLASPLPPMDPATSPEVDPIAALEIGQRLAICVKGDWTTATLVWRSDNGQFLLFAGGKGGRLSATRRSLQRLLDEGLASLPDAGSALARAAGRIVDGSQR